MTRQGHELSCGAACARQILLDAGIDCSEAEIRERAGFFPETGGIFGGDLASALGELHPTYHYRFISADPDARTILFQETPFIAMLGDHWVIVDRVYGHEVFTRDPAGLPNDPNGFEGVLPMKSFERCWERGLHQTVFRFKK